MEELAIMDAIVVLGQCVLDETRSLVDSLEVVLPGEVDAEHDLVLCWAQRDKVRSDAPDLCDLDQVAEAASLRIDVPNSTRQVCILHEELGLNLVAIRRRWLIRLEVINLLVPHAEARCDAWVRAAQRHRVRPLSQVPAEPLCVANLRVALTLDFIVACGSVVAVTRPNRVHLLFLPIGEERDEVFVNVEAIK